MDFAFILQPLKWAVQSGIISAGTAVSLFIFASVGVYWVTRTSKDFNKAIDRVEASGQETANEIRGQVAIQAKHLDSCEKRYEQLRTDLGNVQATIGETQAKLWHEVLGRLRDQ